MRLSGSIEKNGYFWLPDDPENALPKPEDSQIGY